LMAAADELGTEAVVEEAMSQDLAEAAEEDADVAVMLSEDDQADD
jgi:hypothetical protein